MMRDRSTVLADATANLPEEAAFPTPRSPSFRRTQNSGATYLLPTAAWD
jgi:hypothetical protein